ncbi:MAG: response regulator transcription factor [Deltaproteobacteria bacterium]|nr:response regulator transcription factor [Deltaproteobacteria bacterium]
MSDIKVLIVDDEVEFASTLAERLELREIAAKTVNNGKDALSVILNSSPDVVILDLKMPDLNGLEVLVGIKAHDPQLEFFGRMLAGFTHDLKNHLAIIKESNGLISDLIDMGRITDEALAARLQKIVTSIQGRVGRATDMASSLNSIAHRQDTPLSTFQINDLISEELALLQRFARLREIEIKTALAPDLPAIHNNPSLVQFVFFHLFNLSLRKLKNHGMVEIASGQHNGAVLVTFRLHGEKESFAQLIDEETAAIIQEALAVLQASVTELSPAGAAVNEIGLALGSLAAI